MAYTGVLLGGPMNGGHFTCNVTRMRPVRTPRGLMAVPLPSAYADQANKYEYSERLQAFLYVSESEEGA